jgi:hypothetical protein
MDDFTVATARFLAKAGVFFQKEHMIESRGKLFRDGKAHNTGSYNGNVEHSHLFNDGKS